MRVLSLAVLLFGASWAKGQYLINELSFGYNQR